MFRNHSAGPGRIQSSVNMERMVKPSLLIIIVLALELLTACVNATSNSTDSPRSKSTITLTSFPAPLPKSTATPTNDSTQLPTVTLNTEPEGCLVTTPPDELKLNPWFDKYCDAGGIAILGFSNVTELAMQQAYHVVMNMFLKIPEYKSTLTAGGIDGNGVKLVIYNNKYEILANVKATLGITATITADDRGLFDPTSGMAITWQSDVLCEPKWGWDQYTIHELAHALEARIIRLDLDLNQTLKDAYNTAVTNVDKWDNTRAMETASEYWAYGVPVYFQVGWEDETNRPVLQSELETEHPQLFQLIKTFFKNSTWKPICPQYRQP